MFALIRSISALIYYFSNFHGQVLIKPWIGKYTIQLHVSDLIKLDILIIRWIRFDRILFSDKNNPENSMECIIFKTCLWPLGHFRRRFGCAIDFKTCIGFHSYNIFLLINMYAYTTNVIQPYFCHLSKNGRE